MRQAAVGLYYEQVLLRSLLPGLPWREAALCILGSMLRPVAHAHCLCRGEWSTGTSPLHVHALLLLMRSLS